MALSQEPQILAQTVVVANTDTTLYTIPADRAAVITAISACNIGATARTFRVAFRLNGVAIANQMYIVFDLTLNGNDTWQAPRNYGMNVTGGADILMVRANHADVVFQCHGLVIDLTP